MVIMVIQNSINVCVHQNDFWKTEIFLHYSTRNRTEKLHQNSNKQTNNHYHADDDDDYLSLWIWFEMVEIWTNRTEPNRTDQPNKQTRYKS